MITYSDFQKVEMRVGKILSCEPFPEARKPAYKLTIDFGESGVKKSSTSTIVPTKSPTVSVPKTLTPTPAMPRAPHLITIKNFAFSPSSITVQKGDNVNWGNEDSAPHTVTFQDGGLSSWTLSTDESFNRNFNTVGTFTYHCNLHPSMTGTVIVTN